MEVIFHFFEGITWQMAIMGFFTILFGHPPGFNLFNWLKAQWNLEGPQVQAMVIAVSMLITALAMFVTDSLGFAGLEFNLQGILAFAGVLYKSSQIAYQRFKDAGSNFPNEWGPA
jgi:hypothetical protein